MHAGRVKLLSAFTALFLCWTGQSHALGGGRPGPLVTYISPLPDSRYILPGTNIIIRTDRLIGADAASKLIRSVTGAHSGIHACAVRVSDDGRTVLYTPKTPFADGEQVAVAIDMSAATWGDPVGAAGGFTFTTAVRRPDLPAITNLLRAAEFPPTVPAAPRASRKQAASLADGVVLPDITVTTSLPTAPGYLFVSDQGWAVATVSALLILRNDGTPVFTRDLGGYAWDFKAQPNGLLTYFDEIANAFLVMDSSYTVIDTIMCGNGYPTDVHELLLLPNGHALLLGDDTETIDMSTIVPGGYPSAQVVGQVIQELDQNQNVVFQWRTFDYFKVTDATHVDLTASWIDDVHCNALDVDTDGNILLSSRHLSEITKINRQTGAIIWRLGGVNNQFTFVNDTLGFSYQHAIRRLSNGHISLFDNGDFHTPQVSRAVEYALDEQNKIATLVWQYRNTPDVFGYAMGNAQRLDNGNTVICWGAGNPTVTEVAPDGTKLYEMTFDIGVYSYRAFRLNWPPTAVTTAPGKDTPTSYMLAQNFPNPFNPTTTIQFSIAQQSLVRLEVFNMLGERIATLVDQVRPAGSYSERFDGTQLASGVYLYRLKAGSFTTTQKMVLLR